MINSNREIIARIVDPIYGVLQNKRIVDELKCYTEKDKWHLIGRVKNENLLIAKEWLLSGYDIVNFIQIQDNGHDLLRALEILRILTILGRD